MEAIKAANNLGGGNGEAASDGSNGGGGGGHHPDEASNNHSRGGRGRHTKSSSSSGVGAVGSSKKQLEAALKAEREKQIKVYKLRYDKYLVARPITNSPFDVLIAASQVKI